ncbi:cytochrome P450 [Streptantibioticus ferralitis]|uniref:Cytochrome P450 n=1 Tax=Streptantibioticus ferralitis TaxID=236510 RepID=A0ABT5Z4U9_9ACTN|nr:cytochrome P450 [Streptantibioticus ferralitis]MDF2258848.1 cytochrome P450 [Streptantibioticus ferralitis]
MAPTLPRTDLDLFSDDVLADPYPVYADLRAQASAIFLERHGAWAIPRYDGVREALSNWRVFSSARGVALNDAMNSAQQGTVLASDPPEHRALRSVLSEQLAPRGLQRLRGDLERSATQLVDALVERDSFDAVTDLAQVFPLAVVADLVGIPDSVRNRLLSWADASFTAFGPLNDRTRKSWEARKEMFRWCRSVRASELAPGSMGRAIFEAADAGIIDHASCAPLLSAYTTAGIDTTVHALSHAVLMFAENPDQWDLVRDGDVDVLDAFDEVLRHDSPVQAFTRVTTTSVDFEDVTVPAGERVVLLFGSGNRDERHYTDPDRFDVTRKPSDHLSFGRGVHSCAGQGLARMEASAVLSALARRVRRWHVGAPVRHVNNVLRGLASLPVEQVELA